MFFFCFLLVVVPKKTAPISRKYRLFWCRIQLEVMNTPCAVCYSNRLKADVKGCRRRADFRYRVDSLEVCRRFVADEQAILHAADFVLD